MAKFNRIIPVYFISLTLAFNSYAINCDSYEAELKSIHQRQDAISLIEGDPKTSLKRLKKERDAIMANVIAVQSLQKIKNDYLKFKEEAQKLDVAKTFGENTAEALRKLETHTQAVVKYGVMHSTVAALAKKQHDNRADNEKESNPFKYVFNHLKNGNGKDLHSFVKSACKKGNEEYKSECSVFNNFTKNFKKNSDYKNMAKTMVDNYGNLLSKIYKGSATPDNARSNLEDHLEILDNDNFDISLKSTKDGEASIDIHSGANSLNLLSNNKELKRYYVDTIYKFQQEYPSKAFDSDIGSKLMTYASNVIQDPEFENISNVLSKIKKCRSTIRNCKEKFSHADLKRSIEKAHRAIGSNFVVTDIQINENNGKKDFKNGISKFLNAGQEQLDTLNITSNNKFKVEDLVTKALAKQCPSTKVEAGSRLLKDARYLDSFYECIEDKLDNGKLSKDLKAHEDELRAKETQIAKLFEKADMRDLEVIKAISMKNFQRGCRESEVREISCMPKFNGVDNGIMALFGAGKKVEDKVEEQFLTENYSRYYYGNRSPANHKQTKKFLDKYCGHSKGYVCNSGKIIDPKDEGDNPDQFSETCRQLMYKKCDQIDANLSRARAKLGKNEYWDWDPISETNVKRKHKDSFWPGVAMYAAKQSPYFIGPMIATQNLRAQMPAYEFYGMAQQQQLAYQEQYYDWYMEKLDLADPNLFNTFGGPFYSTTVDFGYAF